MEGIIGQVLNGRYEVRERLGGGGMAEVYQARDAYLGRPVSLKVLRPQFATDTEFLQRFRREAQAVASLGHPNIVSLFDVGHDPDTGLHYLVMEYVEGDSLKEKIAREGPFPARQAVEIVGQILDGLEHAHQKRVIHRDVKSHNILVTPGGRVKVTDFGIARALNGTTLVHTGGIVGSAHYFSPEQAQGRLADERSDIYALGVVLFELVTGKVPFEGENPVAVALKHVQEEAPSPRSVVRSVPDPVSRIVRKALAKDPNHRYQTAAEFRADLDAWRRGQPVAAFADEAVAEDEELPAPPGWEDDTLVPIGPGGRDRTLEEEEEDGDPPDASARRRGRGGLWAALAGFLLLVGLIGYGVYAFLAWFQVPTVVVPDVLHKSLTEANRVLVAKGLYQEVVGERSDPRWPANVVIEQQPAAGQEVRRGRTISLIVSRGPEMVAVPRLVDHHRQEAETLLRNADLGLKETTIHHEKVPEGYVIDQNPREGTRVQQGWTVYITVSKGPPPPPFNMPSLVGSTVDDARRTLEDAKLRVGRVSESMSGFKGGIVAQQVPAAGATVREGDRVDLVVSQGCAAIDQRTVTMDSEVRGTLRVVVIDGLGERVVHEAEHDPQEQVPVEICWDGTVARLLVYSNDELRSQDLLPRKSLR